MQTPTRWRLAVSAVLVPGLLVAVAQSPVGAFTAIVLFSLIGALNAALVDDRAVASVTAATTAVTFVAVLLTGTGGHNRCPGRCSSCCSPGGRPPSRHAA